MSASSKPRQMWVRSHNPGASRLGGMGRVQAAPAAQADLTPSGGVSNLPGGCLSRHASLLILGAEVGVGRSSSHTGQAQLSKLQAGLADGHCHCRASHWIWPMRGHPVHLPEGGVGSPPPAHEAQCSFQVSVPTEESAQLGMKRKQARPAAQTPPRTHPRDQSQAATGLGTPSSDPEPREPLPLRQQEDLEPSIAEHRGEEAAAGACECVGRGC